MKKIKQSKIIKPFIIICLLFLTLTLGTTIAYLTDSSEEVKNTFTHGAVKISITESNIVEETEKYKNEYIMKPGLSITKDPVITVEKNSEDCWLFIEITKSSKFDDYLTYTIEDNWKSLDGYDNIYYQEVSRKSTNQEFTILKDNKVEVKSTIGNEELDVLEEKDYPVIDIKAYAVQKDSDIKEISSADEAWKIFE